ncbi:S8 family serine peptidase [Bergeyella cardium]|uniref:S8 family serine peptidase n=1 Tax=Bergeyella cardium TaxID=1585976 RepID=UPI0021AABDA4|nr:S8 family serine peptidase [Bergeyella cardium]WHE33408.1 S8 family serine peptidase [Bergeyella cardium]WHF60058.1 S8 family serine peptidase [Bergeyella cardium]
MGGYKTPSDVKAASFSAFGPTNEGRIKPDLVGIGVNVFSANSDRDSSYEEMSGTSMASPNVTGSLALVQEYYNKNYSTTAQPFMRANTLKALTIHTANEAGEHAGPNYKFGWGLLNVLRAVEVLSVKDNFSFVNENTLQNRSKYEIKVKAKSDTEPLKVTIVWDDPVPATENMPAYTLNNRQSVLVNDLDLRITDGVETFYPWVLNPDKPTEPATREDNARDNVEQIIIDHPVEGKEYTIMVSSKRDLRKNLKQGSVSAL